MISFYPAMLAQAPDVDPPTDLDLLAWIAKRGIRPNVVVMCAPGCGDAVEARMAAGAEGPVRVCALPGPLALPARGRGTLILNDVACLTADQQAALFDWLGTVRGRIQVISLTERRIEAMVAAGHFDPNLYYRLNTIRIS
jgi:transcriptional regulator of acetoin/glycerol metabolism